MRFLALALFVVAAASCCLADDVEELVNMAQQLQAPFTQTALKRIQDSGLWGAKRANRTTDVIIFNPSKRGFELTHNDCALGAFNSGLMPENQIKERTSSVYGMDSSLYLQGVHCTITYKNKQSDSYFTVMLENPFYGDNVIYTSSSYDLKVVPLLGHGQNNQARITVSDARSPWPMSSGSTRSLSQQKGGRNIAIKASKSGKRYHTL